jgi:N-acetylmuramoyl-L-alanine amidase
VRTFQTQRDLPVDGICGPITWGAVVEAGHRPGDRLLYDRRPMLRGDDVAQLQRRLDELGFDPRRVDGIFGPDTRSALEDFQRNAGLVCDGVCGPETLAMLDRLGRVAGTSEQAGSVAAMREEERLRCAPPTLAGRRVAVGHTGDLDALASAVARSLRDAGAVVVQLRHPDQSQQAGAANDGDVDVYLGLATVDAEADRPACTVAHYAGHGYESPGGRSLAALVTVALAPILGAERCRAQGMNLPILRETRMPAVLCRVGPPSTVVQQSAAIARALCAAVSSWARRPVEGSDDR